MSEAERPDSLAAYTLVLLVRGEHCLLLRRAEHRERFPGRWTGLGGRVEPHELERLRAAALRELGEEAGLRAEQVRNLALRRALLHARPGGPLTLLLYFTGELAGDEVPENLPQASPEGELRWVRPDELERLDLVDNARLVLPLLLEDARRDPDGREPVKLGSLRYSPEGLIESIVWA
ncbi:Nucleoside triphosphatase NudI [bacterium HR26]|nr:Nucleoside triphosphatase NudI [bacterium HR26]